MTMYGVECPACGSVRTGTAKAGFDGDGNRIRVRKCSNCDHSFTTVEAAYPFTFSRTDVLYRDRDRRMYARRVGYIPQSVPYWSRDVLKVSVSVTPGKRTNRCRKGLHVLTPDNIDIRPNGYRVCRTCRRIAQRLWRDENRTYINLKRRERKAA